MNILVTGGAGYVGSHACSALRNAGFTPVTYDNLSRGFRALVRYGPFEQGDILDEARLTAVLNHYRPGAVMHFAALAYVGESVTAPLDYYRNNFAGALSLLSAMRACGIDRFVFSSTCAVYGTPEAQPMAETLPRAPINPYGRSKLMVEQALADASAAYGFRSVSLRYFNAGGAHPSREIGELHEPETHLIPRALMAANGEIDAIEIFGTDYPTPDGTAIRDYIHVCDLGDAHVSALRYLQSGGVTTALNLGTGRGYSVREVLDAVARVAGVQPPSRKSARRPGDPAMLVADGAAAMRVLDFAPKWNDLDGIVASAWDWHRSHAPGPGSRRAGDASPAR
ncbi:MAG TPA: UDP-glucose 4-epimerase GalE [Rhizomicrobium sp.]|nr:UDP-glucose 4-epimerase GalE [Rhizomicrobium sp.]